MISGEMEINYFAKICWTLEAKFGDNPLGKLPENSSFSIFVDDFGLVFSHCKGIIVQLSFKNLSW